MTQTGFVSFVTHAVRQRYPTGRRGWPRVANLALTLAALLFAAPVFAQAQPGTVSGTVLVEGAQRPLAGAQITVDGVTGVGTTSDARATGKVTSTHTAYTTTRATVEARSPCTMSDGGTPLPPRITAPARPRPA